VFDSGVIWTYWHWLLSRRVSVLLEVEMLELVKLEPLFVKIDLKLVKKDDLEEE
jgi:hypothetical protein